MYIFDKSIPELSFLGFRRVTPHPCLQPYIQCYWLADAMVPLPRQENFYPDGGTGLVFSFAEPFLKGNRPLHGSFFQGLEFKATSGVFQGRISVLGVRFRPGGAQAFFPVPTDEISDPLYALVDVDPQLAAWQERLGNLKDMPSRLAHLERVLCDRQTDVPRLDLIARFRELGKRHPRLSVDRAAWDLGVSLRDLERVFRKQVGISPKQLLCILRVDRVRRQLKKAKMPSLSCLAQDAGYFDQSHFIREFKRVVGMTPRAYRKRAEGRVLHSYPSPRMSALAGLL